MAQQFVDKTLVNQNSVWNHFQKSIDGTTAKCKICASEKRETIIKTGGGSTSGLHTHLRTIHKIVTKRVNESEASTSQKKFNDVQPKITKFYDPENDESLPAVLSKMIALDGFCYFNFIESIELRKCLSSRGFEVPKSQNTISGIVFKYSLSIQNKISIELQKIRKAGKCFTLTFDEWSSTKNKRYLCLNIHVENEFWNLGLIRAFGYQPAEKCAKLIEDRLKIYSLSIKSDVFGGTTDGVRVMVSLGKLLNFFPQLCIAHAIHLAVLDVLYKKRSHDDENDFLQEPEMNDDDDNEILDQFEVTHGNDEEMELVIEYQPLIEKVRKIVKLFRRSPSKNDEVLQKYVKVQFNQELQLLLDTKTRWNSLLTMLERFEKLIDCVQKSLIDVKSQLTISKNEKQLISEITSTLLPIKLAVEGLCKRDATLITADATVKFMINNIGSSELAKQLKNAIIDRVNARRTKLWPILHFLHKGTFSTNANSPFVYEKLPKKDLVNEIVAIVKRISFPEGTQKSNENQNPNENTLVDNDSSSDAEEIPMSLKEKLARAIEDENQPVKFRESTSNDIEKIIRREISIFEETGRRGDNLQLAYDAIKSIPPTSVEAERIFSSTGRICTKIRSNLSDSNLDALCLLRSYFMKKKIK